MKWYLVREKKRKKVSVLLRFLNYYIFRFVTLGFSFTKTPFYPFNLTQKQKRRPRFWLELRSIPMTPASPAPVMSRQKIMWRMIVRYRVTWNQQNQTHWKKNSEMMSECIRRHYMTIIRKLFTRPTHHTSTMSQIRISSLQTNIMKFNWLCCNRSSPRKPN